MSAFDNITGPLFLIGYMGSGKTTLGRALACRLGCGFVDLDDYIEQTAGASVKEIFANEGEAGFRMRERKALEDIVLMKEVNIVACGGGTPCFFDNMEYMNEHGTTVLLDATLESLNRRLTIMRSNRPLIANLNDDELAAYIVKALESRMPYYQKARYRFASDRLEDQSQIDESVDAFLKIFTKTIE